MRSLPKPQARPRGAARNQLRLVALQMLVPVFDESFVARSVAKGQEATLLARVGVEGSLPVAFRAQRLARAQRQPVVCPPQVARLCSRQPSESLRQQRAVPLPLEMQGRRLAWQHLFRRPSEPRRRKTSLHPNATTCLLAEKEPVAGHSRRVWQPMFLAKGFARDRLETSAAAPTQAELLERMAQLFFLGQSAPVSPDWASLRQPCLS